MDNQGAIHLAGTGTGDGFVPGEGGLDEGERGASCAAEDSAFSASLIAHEGAVIQEGTAGRERNGPAIGGGLVAEEFGPVDLRHASGLVKRSAVSSGIVVFISFAFQPEGGMQITWKIAFTTINLIP